MSHKFEWRFGRPKGKLLFKTLNTGDGRDVPGREAFVETPWTSCHPRSSSSLQFSRLYPVCLGSSGGNRLSLGPLPPVCPKHPAFVGIRDLPEYDEFPDIFASLLRHG